MLCLENGESEYVASVYVDIHRLELYDAFAYAVCRWIEVNLDSDEKKKCLTKRIWIILLFFL